MKKIYQTAMLALISSVALAQSFFVPTTYRGAFEPGVAMWTEGWTNWDPQNTVYGTGKTATDWTTANITTNTTWTADKIYTVKQATYVKNGATLTIEPGTVVLFDKAAVGAGLFITMGSKIMAQGTATSPIVFTSNQAPGSRTLGDWGGIVLLGKASNNQTGGVAYIEGIAPTADTQHGGGTSADDTDNSGVLSYVRIEWAGYVYQPDKEINAITFGSVGSKTTVDHIQVSYANDDAFEWFGGTVNCRYLVSYRNLDDDFDTDFGYRGFVQFGLSVRDPQIADQSASSTSEGFESDNDASGTTNTPQTAAIFSNMTLIGPYRGSTANTIDGKFRRGARIRRNSGLKIYNSIFMDHNRGIHVDGTACEANANNGTLKFKNNIVAGTASGKICERNTGSTFDIWSWFASSKNDSLTSTAGILTTPYDYTNPDYRPAAGSIALSGSDFTDSKISPYVLNEPTVSDVAYCVGETAMQLTATGDAGATILWYTSATGGTGSETAPTPSTNAPGTMDYYVSQWLNGAESYRDTITVTVHALPIASVTASGATSFCIGGSVTLTSSSSTGNVWSTNETTNSIVVTTSGTYKVMITDVNSCKDTSDAVVVSVSSSPVPTISASGALSFCEGDSVVLTSSVGDTYLWSTGATTKAITVKSAGTYHVTTTNADACLGAGMSADAVVTVGTVPVAAATIASKAESVLTFSNSSTGATSYSWDFGDNTSSSQENPIHAYASNGTYTIVLTAIKGACSDTVTLIGTINVGIAELKGNDGSVSIYPNPVQQQSTLEFNLNDDSNINVNVYDIAGHVVATVYQGKLNAGVSKLTLDASALTSGIYFVSIASEQGQTLVKIVVEK